MTLVRGDVAVDRLAAGSAFDAVLHDPPRFGIAGELYSQAFYDHLARVLKPRGVLFHYTGTPKQTHLWAGMCPERWPRACGRRDFRPRWRATACSPSEGLQERNERALVVVAQLRLLAE